MKTVLLAIMTLGFSSLGLSQRMASLVVTNVEPEDNSSVPSDSTVVFVVSVKNVGTETIGTSDTLAFYATVNGNSIQFDPENTDFKSFTGNTLSPGDSVQLSTIIVLESAQYGGTVVDVCITVVPLNSADPIEDVQPDDNESCISVFVEQGLGINELNEYAVSAYPNPASDKFFLSSDHPIRAYTILDNQGRTITGGSEIISGIDCSQWLTGLYFVVVELDSGVSVEPVTVRH